MKISYDTEVDALSIVFQETTVTTKHLADGIAADYDSNGQLVGIEILDALKRLGGQDTLRQVILEGVGPSLQPIAKSA
jgi:YD repeat-containing protein